MCFRPDLGESRCLVLFLRTVRRVTLKPSSKRIFLLSLNTFTTYTLHIMYQYCQFNITLSSFFSFHAGDKQPPLKKVQSTRKRFRFYVYSPEHDRECEAVKVISSHLLVAGPIVTKQRINTNITSLTRTPF